MQMLNPEAPLKTFKEAHMIIINMFLKQCILMLLVFSTVPLNATPVQDSIKSISIKAIAGLQYDLVRFTVQPGAEVKITFSNTDDMSHNLLITKPGTREQVVNAAMQLNEKGPEMNYIPQSPHVLWSIPVLAPGQTKSITFTAPKETGVYPYVCTFPGHGFVMYGAMYVTADGKMPDVKKDINIPPSRRKNSSIEEGNATGHHPKEAKALHPFKPSAPYLYRTYMEDASPAAIAVNLPQNLSYCWDAGTCRLRYAWEGDFLDNQTLWKGKPNAVGNILGTIFFKDDAAYPIRIGNSEDTPDIKYKGYRLINRYPEFKYTFNGTDVYELIHPKEDGSGIIRTFRIPGSNQKVFFYCETQDDVECKASKGKWENGRLILSPQEAQKFTITISKNNNL